MNRLFVISAIALALPALSGCVVAGQNAPPGYAQPYPPPPFQPQCQQTPAPSPLQGPTISCTRPDGTVSTTPAPPAPPAPPSAAADQGDDNQPYPPPPPQGYNSPNNTGY